MREDFEDDIETGEGEVEESESPAKGKKWLDKDEYVERGGNPDKWVSQEEFAAGKREADGYSLKRQLRKLEQTNRQLAEDNRNMAQHFASMAAAQVKAVQRDYDKRIAEIEAQQEEAEEADDVKAFKRLQAKKDKLSAEKKEATADVKEAVEKEKQKQIHIDEESAEAFEDWKEANEWFGKDKKKTRIAKAIIDEIDAENPTMPLKKKIKLFAAEIREQLGGDEEEDEDEAPTRRVFKKAGGRAAGFSSGTSGIPRDAKEYGEKWIRDNPELYQTDGKPDQKKIKGYWDDMRAAYAS